MSVAHKNMQNNIYKKKTYKSLAAIYKILTALFIVLFALTILPSAEAAVLKGNVYDMGLEPINNVIVYIDTDPAQQHIVKDYGYSFELPAGRYTITAKYYEDNILKYEYEEAINVDKEGEFVHDIILFPSFKEDEKLFEEISFELNEAIEEDYTGHAVLWAIAGMMLLWIIVIAYIQIRKRLGMCRECPAEDKGDKGNGEKVQANIKDARTEIEEGIEEDEYYTQVLALVKKHKRITQKEIRKQIPLSEAKISLIISEMEHKGVLEKIKKGRGNIIIKK